MTYAEKIKFCRDTNNNPIYQEFANGIRCSCYRDVYGNEHLEVLHKDNSCNYNQLHSSICNDWEEDYITEWIFHATNALKGKLGLFGEVF